MSIKSYIDSVIYYLYTKFIVKHIFIVYNSFHYPCPKNYKTFCHF